MSQNLTPIERIEPGKNNLPGTSAYITACLTPDALTNSDTISIEHEKTKKCF